jgi:hypothetical protein
MDSTLYEHAFEWDERDDVYHTETRAPWACSACGGWDWPDPHSSCPLCAAEPEPEPDEPEPDEPEK